MIPRSVRLKRGEVYRVHKPGADPKLYRFCVVVSRQTLIDSRFSTVICAPIFTQGQALSTQVAVGPEHGLKHPSWIMCDNLISARKTDLTHYVSTLPPGKIFELDRALEMALDLG